MSVDELRQDLRGDNTPHLRQRHVTLRLALARTASMTPVTLLQMGVLQHLPEPSFRSFTSDKVNSSYGAYRFGSSLQVRQPWMPRSHSGTSTRCARIEKAWCVYCISGQFTSLNILASMLPEARAALAALRGR